jgi:hypothetical protein
VLGKDSVLKLQQLKLVLDLLGSHPNIVTGLKLPSVYVSGGGALDGPAAILGSFLQHEAVKPPASASQPAQPAPR